MKQATPTERLGPRSLFHGRLRRRMFLIKLNVFRQPDWRRDLKPQWIRVGNYSDLCMIVLNGIVVAQVQPDDQGDFQGLQRVRYVIDLRTLEYMEGIDQNPYSFDAAVKLAEVYSEHSFRRRFGLDTRIPVLDADTGVPIPGEYIDPERQLLFRDVSTD